MNLVPCIGSHVNVCPILTLFKRFGLHQLLKDSRMLCHSSFPFLFKMPQRIQTIHFCSSDSETFNVTVTEIKHLIFHFMHFCLFHVFLAGPLEMYLQRSEDVNSVKQGSFMRSETIRTNPTFNLIYPNHFIGG